MRAEPWARRALCAGLVLALSALLVNRHGPELVQADTLMVSLMSLQQLTLFFWGQDRLLNLQALLIWPLRDPAANLMTGMLLAAATFFALAWYWSARLVDMFGEGKQGQAPGLSRMAAFLLTTALALLVVRPAYAFEFSVNHFEQCAPYLLLAAAWRCMEAPRLHAGLRWLFIAVLLVLAIGVNFTTMLPAAACVLFPLAERRGATRRQWTFLALAIAAGIAWMVTSKLYPAPGGSYYSAELAGAPQQVWQALQGLSSTLGEAGLALLALAIAAVLAGRVLRRPQALPPQARLMSRRLAIFGVLWLLLFSVNGHVVANALSYRYFAPVLFAGVMILSMLVAAAWLRMPARARAPAAAALLALAALPLIAGPTPLLRYRAMAGLPDLERLNSEAAPLFFAGDYWRAWPWVMKTLLQGRDAYGLADRAPSTRDLVLPPARQPLAAAQGLHVVCAGTSDEVCDSQVGAVLGPVHRIGRETLAEGVSLLSYSNTEQLALAAGDPWRVMKGSVH